MYPKLTVIALRAENQFPLDLLPNNIIIRLEAIWGKEGFNMQHTNTKITLLLAYDFSRFVS